MPTMSTLVDWGLWQIPAALLYLQAKITIKHKGTLFSLQVKKRSGKGNNTTLYPYVSIRNFRLNNFLTNNFCSSAQNYAGCAQQVAVSFSEISANIWHAIC